MDKIVITIEVDEESRAIKLDFDVRFLDDSLPWEKMTFAQKLAKTFVECSDTIVKAVIENEEGRPCESRTIAKRSSRYPQRCRIVENDGQEIDTPIGTLVTNTPEKGRQKAGRTGTAYLEPDGRNVRIKLDDGGEIMGSECWWEPIADAN